MTLGGPQNWLLGDGRRHSAADETMGGGKTAGVGHKMCGVAKKMGRCRPNPQELRILWKMSKKAPKTGCGENGGLPAAISQPTTSQLMALPIAPLGMWVRERPQNKIFLWRK